MRGCIFVRLGAASMVTAALLVACGTDSTGTGGAAPGDDAGGSDVYSTPVTDDAATPDGAAPLACDGQPDGTVCGTGKMCLGQKCIDGACGDGFVTPPEECDRAAANAAGSGCEPTCTFSCAANDSTRNCKSADPCISDGTCDATLHTCTAGSPQPSTTTCGNYKYCAGGACKDGACGDGIVTSPEQCDNGVANGAKTGCETTCKFSCANAATDCAPLACNTATCSAAHTCSYAPDATQNGHACGSGGTCQNGACNAPGATCGNGVVETGEECDFGAQNGAGTGCEPTCKYSCASATDCTDSNPCDTAPTCQTVTVSGHAGKKCVLGTSKPDGTTCGTGSICIANVCKASVCGDGVRDDAKGEQCDDANTKNLDACDMNCKFEQDQRAIALKVQFGVDAYCTVNALGTAIKGAGQSQIQGGIDSSVASGGITALFKFVGDVTGTSGAVTAGNLSGTPVAGTGYSGTSDEDWWYTADATSVDGSRNALAQLTGSYTNGAVDLVGMLNLHIIIGTSPALMHMSGARLHATIGAPTTLPKASTGATPGHLASEHLSPTLKSYPTMGGTAGAPTAQICGNISANSLASTAIPSNLTSGFTKCSEGYTAQNTALDLFVHGCHVIGSVVIAATQPDQVDSSAPVAGAGGPYTFGTDASHHVNLCKDKNGATVALSTCLNAAAYSSSFKFATDRVIIK